MIIRRHRSLTSTPKMLDSFLGVSFGSTCPPIQSRDSHGARQTVRSALKKFVALLFSGDRQEAMPQDTFPPLHPVIQPEPTNMSESLLKAEQEGTSLLRQELLTARAALKQMDDLQAELAVERETGKQLVNFLEAAEQEARKVPILEQLLRQQDDIANTTATYPSGEYPIMQRPETP